MSELVYSCWIVSHCHLVQHDSERPHVDSGADLDSSILLRADLWRYVAHSTTFIVHQSKALTRALMRKAEINQLYLKFASRLV